MKPLLSDALRASMQADAKAAREALERTEAEATARLLKIVRDHEANYKERP